MGGMYGGWWPPYVSVAERRKRAEKEVKSQRKKGINLQPVVVSGKKIAESFWGLAWCEHLESFSDYSNRLPRGRSYLRNGSVYHLEIKEGAVVAQVLGSYSYKVEVKIKTLPNAKWRKIKRRCAGQVATLLDLLQGKLSKEVMRVVCDRKEGLFPLKGEISLRCSCPDWAVMCKHVAAVLYGIGARLDLQPELLFLLRGVDHQELIQSDPKKAVSDATGKGRGKRLSQESLADVFGVEIDTGDTSKAPSSRAKSKDKAKAKGKIKARGAKATAKTVKAKPKAKVKVKARTTTTTKAKAKAKPKAKAKVRATTTTKAKAKPKAKSRTTTTIKPKAKAKATATAMAKPKPKPKAKPKVKATGKTPTTNAAKTRVAKSTIGTKTKTTTKSRRKRS